MYLWLRFLEMGLLGQRINKSFLQNRAKFSPIIENFWNDATSDPQFLVNCPLRAIYKNYGMSLPRLNYKRLTSVLLSHSLFLSLALMKQAAMLYVALWRGPCGKELRAASGQQLTKKWGLQSNNLVSNRILQQPCEWAWKWIPPQTEPWDGCRHGWHLDCSLMRDPEPEDAANLDLKSLPIETEILNVLS